MMEQLSVLFQRDKEVHTEQESVEGGANTERVERSRSNARAVAQREAREARRGGVVILTLN